jgi:hypothetical protein
MTPWVGAAAAANAAGFHKFCAQEDHMSAKFEAAASCPVLPEIKLQPEWNFALPPVAALVAAGRRLE